MTQTVATALDTLPLGPSGRVTTKLGFGCSGVTGGLGKRASLRLLETAFDAGIRHFDVAPMYGYGTAEEVLGEFLQRHPGAVTVTTKYGIPAPASGGALSALRAVVRPVANRLPALRKRLIQRADQAAQTTSKASFTPADATRSLEASLRKLRVDRLDLFLLHDAEPADLHDDGLLRMLQDAQQAGKVVHFGVGSPARVVDALVATHARYCAVVQHEWSAVAEALPSTDRFHLCHRTIAGAAPTIQAWLQDAALAKEWSRQVDADVTDADMLAALLLKGSLLLMPGAVLFSSRQQRRVQQNAMHAGNSALAAPALRLYDLVRRYRSMNDTALNTKVVESTPA